MVVGAMGQPRSNMETVTVPYKDVVYFVKTTFCCIKGSANSLQIRVQGKGLPLEDSPLQGLGHIGLNDLLSGNTLLAASSITATVDGAIRINGLTVLPIGGNTSGGFRMCNPCCHEEYRWHPCHNNPDQLDTFATLCSTVGLKWVKLATGRFQPSRATDAAISYMAVHWQGRWQPLLCLPSSVDGLEPELQPLGAAAKEARISMLAHLARAGKVRLPI